MNTDALSRRLRFAPPNPEARPKDAPKNLTLTEADFAIFAAINRHGPLPSNFLYELTKHLRKGRTRLLNRLTEFYNGDSGGPYLRRPEQQFAGYYSRYQHVVYDLAPRAKTALAEQGRLARYSPKKTEHFLHQLMQACVGASLELACKEKGLRYISREEILTHGRCPESTRAQANPLAIPLFGMGAQKAITPDDLFGIEYPGKGFRFFAVEIDRNTESIERKDPSQNTFGKKIMGYLSLLGRRTFLDHWGVPNLHVLTVTTNANHALNLIDFVKRQQDKNGKFFLFQSEPTFGANWRVPRAVLYQLLNEPWNSTVGDRSIEKA